MSVTPKWTIKYLCHPDGESNRHETEIILNKSSCHKLRPLNQCLFIYFFNIGSWAKKAYIIIVLTTRKNEI